MHMRAIKQHPAVCCPQDACCRASADLHRPQLQRAWRSASGAGIVHWSRRLLLCLLPAGQPSRAAQCARVLQPLLLAHWSGAFLAWCMAALCSVTSASWQMCWYVPLQVHAGRPWLRSSLVMVPLCCMQVDGDAEATVVHCPNTGPMTGLLNTPLAPCWLSRSLPCMLLSACISAPGVAPVWCIIGSVHHYAGQTTPRGSMHIRWKQSSLTLVEHGCVRCWLPALHCAVPAASACSRPCHAWDGQHKEDGNSARWACTARVRMPLCGPCCSSGSLQTCCPTRLSAQRSSMAR